MTLKKNCNSLKRRKDISVSEIRFDPESITVSPERDKVLGKGCLMSTTEKHPAFVIIYPLTQALLWPQ